MTAEQPQIFDQRIADWLEADPDRAPSQVLETVLAAMPSVPQRRRPWGRSILAGRLWPQESRLAIVFAAILLAATLVIGAGLLATFVLPPRHGPISPGPSGSAGPSPTASTEPSASPGPTRAPFFRPTDPGSAIPGSLLGTWYEASLHANVWILRAGDPECLAVVSTRQDCTVWTVEGSGDRIAYAAILTIQDGLLAIHWVDATCAPAVSRYSMTLQGDTLALDFVTGSCDSGQQIFVRAGTNGAPSLPPDPPRPTP